MKLTFILYLLLNLSKVIEKPLKSQNKWKLFLGKEVLEEEWENVYSSTFNLLNDAQFQSFQYLLLNPSKVINPPSLSIKSLIKKIPFLNQFFFRKTCLLATFIFVLYQRCWIRAFSGVV
jgi:hypothetical protein